MLGAGIYPITIVEMLNYTKEADEYLPTEEHDSLKTFLALHPESGDVIAGTNGVRLLRWPLKPRTKVPLIAVKARVDLVLNQNDQMISNVDHNICTHKLTMDLNS